MHPCLSGEEQVGVGRCGFVAGRVAAPARATPGLRRTRPCRTNRRRAKGGRAAPSLTPSWRNGKDISARSAAVEPRAGSSPAWAEIAAANGGRSSVRGAHATRIEPAPGLKGPGAPVRNFLLGLGCCLMAKDQASSGEKSRSSVNVSMGVSAASQKATMSSQSGHPLSSDRIRIAGCGPRSVLI